MKRVIPVLIVIFSAVCWVRADNGDTQRSYPKYQNPGAVDVGTTTCVSVATTPAIALSTPIINYGFFETSGTVQVNPFGTIGVQNFQSTSTASQFIPGRLYCEFWNDTSTDVYVGFNNLVSTQAGMNYGRRLPPQSAWSHSGSIENFWLVASTPTSQKFVITQER